MNGYAAGKGKEEPEKCTGVFWKLFTLWQETGYQLQKRGVGGHNMETFLPIVLTSPPQPLFSNCSCALIFILTFPPAPHQFPMRSISNLSPSITTSRSRSHLIFLVEENGSNDVANTFFHNWLKVGWSQGLRSFWRCRLKRRIVSNRS